MPSHHNNALIIASKQGHLEAVRLHLDNGFPIDTNNGKALTQAIKHATEDGRHLKLAKYLISNGITLRDEHHGKVYYRHKEQRAPIYYAAKEGYLDLVILMEQRGINLSLHKTVMKGAVEGRHINMVEYLISKGAKYTDDKYNTAIMWSAKNGNLTLFKYFESNRLDQSDDYWMIIALGCANRNKHISIVEYLISKPYITAANIAIAITSNITIFKDCNMAKQIIEITDRDVLEVVLDYAIRSLDHLTVQFLMQWYLSSLNLGDAIRIAVAASEPLAKYFLERGMIPDDASILQIETSYLIQLIPRYPLLQPSVLGELTQMHSRIWKWKDGFHSRLRSTKTLTDISFMLKSDE